MSRCGLRAMLRWQALAVLVCCAAVGDLAAQQPRTRPGTRLAAPSRADTLLAEGRLAAAEAELYAAANARPRDPAARGALAAYLASRGRFPIALVLLDEAQRFGADQARVRAARSAIVPYTTAPAAGPETTVPFLPPRAQGTLGLFAVRTVREAPATQLVALDPNRTGLVAGAEAAARFEITAGRPLRELWVGDRRLLRIAASVDTTLAPDEMRVGFDVLWGLAPLVDQRAGTLTLGRALGREFSGEQIPWVLTFPGLQLVPRVGQPPLRIESAPARALLRGTRWQIDPAGAVLRVER